MEERQNSSSSCVFRPILEPPDQQQHHQQLQVGSGGGSHTFSSDRLSVNTCGGGGVRKRVNSGGPSPLTNLDGSRPTPKLYSCWRATGGSQEAAWSSQGSRHSSRPGSTTSSRPSSQCCNVPASATAPATAAAVSSGAGACIAHPPGSLLYSKSNNSSTSDVSVSKNFQQLTVSTRRAAFRTQKWSHSLDQPCVSSAQTSPGRRRQTSLQQKSLDLDSGYLGSSTGDLKSVASYSQSSWNNDVVVGAGGRHPIAAGAGGVCSPISDARQELKELRHGLETAAAVAAATAAMAPAMSSSNDDLISRSASMPAFCGDPPHAKPPCLRQQMLEASHHLSVLESVTNLDLADDLDEEIKMIVAQGDSGGSGQRCGARGDARSPFFQPDMQEVLSLLDNAAAGHCPLLTTTHGDALQMSGRTRKEGGGGAKHENGDNDSASGDIVLIVPPHVRRPEPTKQRDDNGGEAAKQRDFFADVPPSGGGSSDVVLGSGQPQQQEEEEEGRRDLLLAKSEPVEGGAAGPAPPSSPPPPPPIPQPTTSRRSRLVRSHRVAEVKEEKVHYHALAPKLESTAMHLEPYNGHVFPSTQSYLASSSTPTSCFQLFGGDGGGAAPPSPSASVDHMVSSPAANVLTPSATATDAVARCGGGGIIFQFPPPQPPMLAAGKDSGWEAMSSSSQHQQQHSPMAISPSFSTLNTPRGSITSTRSQHSSHSPMGMIVDSASMVPGQHSAEQAYHLEAPPPIYLGEPVTAASVAETVPSADFTFHDLNTTYPSPPRSGYNSPVPPPQQQQHHSSNGEGSNGFFDPPPYGTEMSPYDHHHHHQHLQQQHQQQPETHLPHFHSAQFVPECLPPLSALTKTEEDEDDFACTTAASPASLHHYNKSLDFCGSEATNSSHPETPDSSVKEEPDCTAPPPASWKCLWSDCDAHEFMSQRGLVDHVNESHMEVKKGYDELPCLWKDCPRKLTPFNAKYKLLTHMRVHTKEKPYPCEFEGCTRSFARLENRKIHQRSHTGDKPFGCKYAEELKCPKRFSNSSDRAKHEQTHKDPKPYRCEVVGCTKRYTDPSSLRKHVKSHTAEEQLQYRRFKDQANAAKRSSSPFSSPSTSAAAAAAMAQLPRPPPTTTQHWSAATARQQAQPTPTNSAHFSSSSVTMLAVGLQSGGTCVLEETASGVSPAAAVSSPIEHQEREHQQRGRKNLASARGGNYVGGDTICEGAGALAHQPNSLDDLDGETLPFDDVPIRYDASANFELPDWTNSTEADPNLHL